MGNGRGAAGKRAPRCHVFDKYVAFSARRLRGRVWVSRMEEVIAAKFDPPVWMGNQIRRDALLHRLDGALSHRLTLVHGPAGYGKTSLLAQWRAALAPERASVGWLALERDDCDLERLAHCLALAIQRRNQAGEIALSGNMPSRAALSAIVNLLAGQQGRFVLVLDDLHHADAPPVLEFLSTLIRLAPANCHFVFASRGCPWLGQSILAAEDQFLEITAEHLKFSDAEAQSLLHDANRPLASEDVAKIIERTEGWPIALQLTSLSLRRGAAQKALIDHAYGSGADLARYLSEQVLARLPEETRQVVMRAALLDRPSGDLVNLLCAREDGWLTLERLEEQGVFLSPVTPDRRAYRFHQLFAQHVRDHFERSQPGEFVRVHRHAAEWFAERGMIADAVNHAILANDDNALADILENAGGWRLIPQGQQGLVERGLARLPSVLVRMRPRVALALVYLKIKLGELGAARAAFDEFCKGGGDARLSADLRTEVRVVGDTLADYENQPVTLDDLLAREALLRAIPANDDLILANMNETLGAKYYEGGWLERALQPTLVAREHYQALGSLYSDLFTRFLEARIKRAQGRMKEAEAILAAAREQIVANFGDRSDLAANCAAFESVMLYESGRDVEARERLAWALPHMEQSDGWVDVYAAAYFTEARALAGQGAYDEAIAVIARARRLAARRRLRQLELLADVCEVELKLAGGDLEGAQSAAAAAELDTLADMMIGEAPHYRPVAIAASLCRVRLRLLLGEIDLAMSELAHLRIWAHQRGAGRLLIDVNMLAAYGAHCLGRIEESRAAFDDAIGIAMFQDVVRPFIDAGPFVEPCLEDVLREDAPVDKYRGLFLKTLEKALAGRKSKAISQGMFSEAEAAVLFHLSQGRSNKEIARLIGMSTDTVKYRLKAVFRKLGAANRRDAVRLSAERGVGLAPTEDQHKGL